PAEQPLDDAYGDPLPEGALARLGTVRFRHAARVDSLSLSADGKILASSGEVGTVRVWDLPSGKEIRSFKGEWFHIALSRDGKTLAAASSETIFVWNIGTGEEIRKIKWPGKFPASWVWGLAFSPDGKVLAGACHEGEIKLWDLSSGKELRSCTGHQGAPWQL